MNPSEVSPAMTAEGWWAFCSRHNVEYWHRVGGKQREECPGCAELPASPVADQMDSAKSADLLAFPEKSKDDPVGFENAIMRQIFLSGYSQALEDHGLPPCEPITVAEAERGIKHVGDRTPVAEGESQTEEEKYSCDTSKDVSNGFICGAWTRRASGPYINFETKQRRMGVYRCDRPDGHKGQHVDRVLGTNFMEDESL